MVEAPPVHRPPAFLPARTLSVIAVLWLAVWIVSAAPGDSRVLLALAAFLFSLLLVLAWIILIVVRLATKRAIGLSGWLVVPMAIAIAWLPPWRDWQFRRAFHDVEPLLIALMAEHEGLPIGETATVRRRVGPFAIEQVKRFEGGTILTISVSPDGESGFVYSTSGSLPTPPGWVVTSSLRPYEPNWWRYSWWDE